MTDILIYITAICITACRALMLYLIFCGVKDLWKRLKHAVNIIYTRMTGDTEPLFSEENTDAK